LRGPITTRLQQAFFDCVAGKDPQHTGWLSYI
jgi:branched-chain amino acid aminotransferase